MNRVLITGATGFVGSRIAAAYAATDCELRCTVRASSDTRWIENTRAELVEADLTDTGALRSALEDVSLVVHSAGVTSAPSEDVFYEVNTEGTLNLAKVSAEAGVERFVFISSLAARGPDPEDAEPGSETPDAPESVYGMSKLAAEERLRGFTDELDVTVLRPGGVYGPRDEDMLLLFQMAERGFLFLPSTEGLLQPVYVGDVARVALLAGEKSAGFGPYPVMDENRYDWDGVAGALEEAVGRSLRIFRLSPRLLTGAAAVIEWSARLFGRAPEFDRRRARDLGLHRWTADPTPTERALGWTPQVALPEGAARTVRWYREHGWL